MKFLITLLAFLTVTKCNAQTGIYNTYDDYLNKNIVVMDSIEDFTAGGEGVYKIKFITPEGKKVNYKTKSMWGFMFAGHLFRSWGDDVGEVIDTGKICYYESGVTHLKMIIDHTDHSTFVYGAAFSFSLSLNSDVLSGYKLRKKHPEFKNLVDCIDNEVDWKVNQNQYKGTIGNNYVERNETTHFKQVQKCVRSFNSK